MIAKRPLLLYLLLLVLAGLAFASAMQTIQTLQSWNWLTVFGYFPSPIYTVFQGVFFLLLFLTCLILLWVRLLWAPVLTGTSFAVYLVWSWVDRLWISVTPKPFSSQLFAAGVSLILFLLAEFSLYLLLPYMRQETVDSNKEVNHG